jgi:hypothetical protein
MLFFTLVEVLLHVSIAHKITPRIAPRPRAGIWRALFQSMKLAEIAYSTLLYLLTFIRNRTNYCIYRYDVCKFCVV